MAHVNPAAPRALDFVLVAAGGAIGALLRAGLNRAAISVMHAADRADIAEPALLWPITFAENIAGSFALALLITAVPANTPGRARARLLLGTGLLGSFTTFSALSADVHALGPIGGAALMMGSVCAGLCAAAGGASIGARFARSRHRTNRPLASFDDARSESDRP